MSFRNSLANFNVLRKWFFPLLRRLDFPIKIEHDLTGRKFHLMSWMHKGYWYYGAKREEQEIDAFRAYIDEGYAVLEVGAHIGYLSQFFEHLIGPKGRLIAVEPTPFSRQFLNKNVKSSTIVLPVALSDNVGEVEFFMEELGGVTNSIEREFTQTSSLDLLKTQSAPRARIESVKVLTSTIDILCKTNDFHPDFIKIDVEGAELRVLKGAETVLQKLNALMVEVSLNHSEVYDKLRGFGFTPYDSSGRTINVGNVQGGNFFFVRQPTI
ncbi:MAG: FkbM family methyltransferase [Arenicella sp.]|nr:FkbM family methyltransferase [Arenicella sp.]